MARTVYRGRNEGMSTSDPEHTSPAGAQRPPVDRNDGFFGADIPVEDRPQGEERKNPGRGRRGPTFPNILAALFSGAIAGLIIWWSLLTAEGQAWLTAVAILIVIAVAAWRGFEPAIAASIAATATVVGLWVYLLAEADDLFDSIVEVAFVGVGTLLGLIIVGGITAAIAQGVRAARRRRATGDRR